MTPAPVFPVSEPEISAQRAQILRHVYRDGAVLLPGVLRSADQLAAIRDALADAPGTARERFAPRTTLGPGVYSALGWAADRILCPQPEQSYVDTPPALLLIGCLAPPAEGGATLLADNRAALHALPRELVAAAQAEGWTLTRMFRDRIGLSWREAFDAATVDEMAIYCSAHDVGLEILPGSGLRTSQRRAAVRTHPVTGESCWANHLAFLNRWSLRADERKVLVSAYGVDGLPFDTFLGADEPLEPRTVATIDEVYADLSRPVRWQRGDVLVIDPALTSTGREPYSGPRELAVAFGA
ncbi:TauD/TfdA family dioxygenase [Amycolatopsis keratiniphila]|uniref:SyrP-like protein n=1 Tax=Amycolatopsis keratiniphila TaxID=129921 RepID=R4T6C7_9PSEU|nr:TauD/TfdA family dioxygenase [Amycolatopsis keratiniphila]AGM07916.1 SyrP-like protein [Amycolatopsis keratiniphila]